MLLAISIALLFLAHSGIAQQQDSLPVQLPQVDIEGRNDGTCPSAEVIEEAQNRTKEEIRSILRDTVVPTLDARSTCPCGGPGVWRRIAHLDMSDPNQQCPSNWQLNTTPVRGCGRLSTSSLNTCTLLLCSHQMAPPIHVCVEESLLCKKDQLMHFILVISKLA